jgi:dynein heavy chain
MGEGQEVPARKAMDNCFQTGGWVVLQNCHLGLKFMEQIINMVAQDTIHEEFRLWITCEQHPKFPLGLL